MGGVGGFLLFSSILGNGFFGMDVGGGGRDLLDYSFDPIDAYQGFYSPTHFVS